MSVVEDWTIINIFSTSERCKIKSLSSLISNPVFYFHRLFSGNVVRNVILSPPSFFAGLIKSSTIPVCGECEITGLRIIFLLASCQFLATTIRFKAPAECTSKQQTRVLIYSGLGWLGDEMGRQQRGVKGEGAYSSERRKLREREEGGKEGIEFDKETLWEPFNLTLSTFI